MSPKSKAAVKGIIGRDAEIEQLSSAIGAGRNILIEGPVGVGKTALAQAVANTLGKSVIRVDGDSRFTEQKLTGWFDPAVVLKKGYSKSSFVAGPLVTAMQKGSILFVNELNRMPESTQNVLLPAIDEGLLQIPQFGEIRAVEGFLVVATQNPREFVATSHISEALMDRMEWIHLGYQSFEEECEIARTALGKKFTRPLEPFVGLAVQIVRLTRNHPKIKRGASIRAAIAVLQLMAGAGKTLGEADFMNAALLALPSRIELLNPSDSDGGFEAQVSELIRDLVAEVKKKSRMTPAT